MKYLGLHIALLQIDPWNIHLSNQPTIDCTPQYASVLSSYAILGNFFRKINGLNLIKLVKT